MGDRREAADALDKWDDDGGATGTQGIGKVDAQRDKSSLESRIGVAHTQGIAADKIEHGEGLPSDRSDCIATPLARVFRIAAAAASCCPLRRSVP